MHEINLAVEIHCQLSIWAKFYIENPKYSGYVDPIYRIYLNQDLITERTWIWDNNIFLDENIWFYGEHNTNYILRLESLLFADNQAAFRLNNLRVLNHDQITDTIDTTSISFKTHKYKIEELQNEIS